MLTKFKSLKFRTKVAVGSVAVATSLAAGGVAFAYVTGASGSGAGTATATAPANLSNLVTTASIANPVAFGGSQSISLEVDNTANAYSVGWAHDTVSIASVSTTTPACPSGSFTVTPGTTDAGGAGTVGASTTTTVSSGYTLNFVDLGSTSNQTGCESATVTFSSSVS